jgi:hypothetical protein
MHIDALVQNFREIRKGKEEERKRRKRKMTL